MWRDDIGRLIRKSPGDLDDLAGLWGKKSLDGYGWIFPKQHERFFRAAGMKEAGDLGERVIKQIEAIRDLGKRTDGFADLVPRIAGVGKADRDAALGMLRARAKKLEGVIPEIRKKMWADANPRAALLERNKELLEGLSGDNVRFFEEIGKDQFEFFLQEMPEEFGWNKAERAAVRYYTSNGYSALNKALRAGGKEAVERVAGFQRTLEGALGKMPDYDEWVYRGTDLPAHVFKRLKIGESFEDKAFISTSLNKGAEFSGRHKFVIRSRRGKRINGLSHKPTEREVLFRPGTRFSVIDMKEQGGRITITMEEIE